MSTHFSSLSDITLLEILSYLSHEDNLHAFADLLAGHDAFQQICLSSSI